MHRLVVRPALVALLCAAGAVAADPFDEVERAADEVLQAVRADDKPKLRDLARRDQPDPWDVAHRLCARGEHDAAAVFAKAAPRKDVEALPAYIDRQRKGDADGAAWRAARSAYAALVAGRPQAALKAVDGVALKGDSVVELTVVMCRGYALQSLDDLARSVDVFLGAARQAEELGYLAGAAQGLNMAATSEWMQGHFDVARRYTTRRLAIEEQRGNTAGMAECTVQIGVTHERVQEYDEALRHLERGLRLWEKLGAEDKMADTVSRMGEVYAFVGELTEALRMYERALALAEKSGNPAHMAEALDGVGCCHTSLGESERAMQCHRRALKLREQVGNPDGIGVTLGFLASAYVDQEKFEDARTYGERACRIYEKLNSPRLAFALAHLSYAYLGLEEYDMALSCTKEGLEIAKRSNNARTVLIMRVAVGAAHLYAGNQEMALPILKKALAEAEEKGLAEVALHAHAAIGESHMRAGRPREAARAIARAMESFGEVYRGLGQEQGAGARKLFAEIFEIGAIAAQELGDPAQACFFLENGRAGTLLESLGGRTRLRTAVVPEHLQAQDRETRLRLAGARAQYETARRAGKLKQARTLKKKLDAVRDELKEVIQKVEREARTAAALLYPKPRSLEDIQGWLRKDEALVLYGLLKKKALALLVTTREARLVPLEKESILTACDALSLDDAETDPAAALAALRKVVVDPLKLGKDTRRLLVSTDGALSYVPLRLLAGDREVVYVPSGTTYGLLMNDRKARGTKVLSVGDPSYAGTLEALPQTREEARAVGDVVLLGKDATVAGLQQALTRVPRWRAVHLACHGLVDPERPLLSSLALTPAAGVDDGLLRAFDVAGLKIPADLVVLSACETGRGKVVHGEGILGFTRAFMLAGTPRVIVSLWPVEDEATQALMRKFYELWKDERVTAGTALHRAQDHVRAQKRWRHPLYWAAWQLWGLP